MKRRNFGFPVSQGSAEPLDRWGEKTKHRLIPYFLSNILPKSDRVCQDYSKSKMGRFLRHSVELKIELKLSTETYANMTRRQISLIHYRKRYTYRKNYITVYITAHRNRIDCWQLYTAIVLTLQVSSHSCFDKPMLLHSVLSFKTHHERQKFTSISWRRKEWRNLADVNQSWEVSRNHGIDTGIL